MEAGDLDVGSAVAVVKVSSREDDFIFDSTVMDSEDVYAVNEHPLIVCKLAKPVTLHRHLCICYLLKPYILAQFQKIPAKNVSKSGLKLLIRGNAAVFIDD
ncbi:hypothetical protein L2E82_29765 [Cichorium intybus]|uniref:Uncharacterized protein n=1 Tax=Cichorium intybus TaxID=13427 RepID=A0ACB9CZ55_CICIN|nr:hypothetical protein L2E82_29765 [Cichorium intybus]